MTMLRLMSIVSWVVCQLDPRCKNKPSLADLWEQLKHPEKEPFS